MSSKKDLIRLLIKFRVMSGITWTLKKKKRYMFIKCVWEEPREHSKYTDYNT